MINFDDVSPFDADDFLQAPPFPDGSNAMQMRDFVRAAIDEGLVLPLATDPLGVLVLQIDPLANPDARRLGGRG